MKAATMKSATTQTATMQTERSTTYLRPSSGGFTWMAGLLITVLLLGFAGTMAAEDDAPGTNQGKIALGKHLFRGYCGSCHGAEAKGDGPIAEYLKVTPTDLTRLAAKNDGEFPFERVVRKIDGREKVAGHGSSEMPVWGQAFQEAEGGGSDDDVAKRIDSLAHYLQSLQVGAKTDG